MSTIPGIIDDIIIKKATLDGLLKAAESQAQEIEELGMLPECEDIDKKLHAAYVPFRDALIWAAEEMKNRLTKKTCQY